MVRREKARPVSSAPSICCESAGGVLFTCSACVQRGGGGGGGGQEERKGSEKEGVERWKGRDGRGKRGGEGSW